MTRIEHMSPNCLKRSGQGWVVKQGQWTARFPDLKHSKPNIHAIMAALWSGPATPWKDSISGQEASPPCRSLPSVIRQSVCIEALRGFEAISCSVEGSRFGGCWLFSFSSKAVLRISVPDQVRNRGPTNRHSQMSCITHIRLC